MTSSAQSKHKKRLVSRLLEKGKVRLIKGYNIYIDAAELDYLKITYQATPTILGNKLVRLIIGEDELKKMTPTGKSNTPKIPHDVYTAVFNYVNKNAPDDDSKLSAAKYRRMLTNLCNTLRNVLKNRKTSELKMEIPISQRKKYHIKNVTGLSDLMNKICVECDIIEKKSLYLRKHNCIKCKKKMMFKCLLCSNIQYTLTQFYDHIETIHHEYEEYLSIYSIITVLYCTKCKNNFELKSAKQSLECPNCSAKLLFQCTSCGIFHETYLNIMNHSRIHCKKELLEAKRNTCNYLSVYKRYCEKCNKISGYTYHKSKGYCEKCELPLSYQCSYCNDTFKTWETVIHHVEKKFSPDGKEINCKICGEGFTSFEDFKIHLLLCENSEKYHVCKSCLFRTYHIEEFEKHLKSSVCSKCRNCKRIFVNKSGLQKHSSFCNKI